MVAVPDRRGCLLAYIPDFKPGAEAIRASGPECICDDNGAFTRVRRAGFSSDDGYVRRRTGTPPHRTIPLAADQADVGRAFVGEILNRQDGKTILENSSMKQRSRAQ